MIASLSICLYFFETEESDFIFNNTAILADVISAAKPFTAASPAIADVLTDSDAVKIRLLYLCYCLLSFRLFIFSNVPLKRMQQTAIAYKDDVLLCSVVFVIILFTRKLRSKSKVFGSKLTFC